MIDAYKTEQDGYSRTPGEILLDIQGGFANLSRSTKVPMASKPSKYCDPACDPKLSFEAILSAIEEDIQQLRRKLTEGTGHARDLRLKAYAVNLHG